MTPEQLSDKLLLVGIDCRVQRDEVLVTVCLFCGNEKANLELNAEKGVYKCWACGTGGRLDRFLRDVTGDRSLRIPVHRLSPSHTATTTTTPSASFASRPAWQVESARLYLQRRGFGEQEALTYGLTVCTQPDHMLYGRLVVPLLDYWTRKTVGHTGRSYSGKKPKYLHDMTHRAITGWRVPGRRVPCVIVEGPFDGIAVHRSGVNVAVLGGTHLSAVADFTARIPPDVPLKVLLDGDAGPAAQRLSALIGRVRATQGATVETLALPPGTDPADFSPDVLRTFIGRSCNP